MHGDPEKVPVPVPEAVDPIASINEPPGSDVTSLQPTKKKRKTKKKKKAKRAVKAKPRSKVKGKIKKKSKKRR